MIQNLTINNFRQFDTLEVNDIKRVNFLVGKNNCGKTSVLEALFWIAEPININALDFLCRIRELGFNHENFAKVFRNNIESNTLNISINNNTNDHIGLTLTKDDNQNDEFTQEIEYVEANTNQKKQMLLNPVRKVYKYNIQQNGNTDEYQIIANQHSFHIRPETKRVRNFHIDLAYIGGTFVETMTIQQLKNIVDNSLEDQLIEYMKIVDEKVNSIGFGANNQILIELVDVDGNKTKLPLQVMGDGFKKFFKIIVAFFEKNVNILEIDEIENGLHHTTQIELLKALLRLSEKKNIQLFITTHSLETLKFLSEIMQEEEFSEQKDDVQVINISKTLDNRFETFNHNIDGLKHFIQIHAEIR